MSVAVDCGRSGLEAMVRMRVVRIRISIIPITILRCSAFVHNRAGRAPPSAHWSAGTRLVNEG